MPAVRAPATSRRFSSSCKPRKNLMFSASPRSAATSPAQPQEFEESCSEPGSSPRLFKKYPTAPTAAAITMPKKLSRYAVDLCRFADELSSCPECNSRDEEQYPCEST